MDFDLVILTALAVLDIIVIALLLVANKKIKKQLCGIIPITALTATALPLDTIKLILGVIDSLMAVAIIILSAMVIINYLRLLKQQSEAEKAAAPAPAPAYIPVPTPAPAPAPAPEPIVVPHVDVVTVEEAETMISDEEAIKLEHFEEKEHLDEYHEDYTGKKKDEINIDTISQAFEPGDRVSLNTLKEKKLLSADVGFVKVLARGTLDKPLTIIAQNFSVAAVKMIVLTGGTVIVAEGSPETRKNK